jgi:hypothetical protein
VAGVNAKLNDGLRFTLLSVVQSFQSVAIQHQQQITCCSNCAADVERVERETPAISMHVNTTVVVLREVVPVTAAWVT